MATSVVQFLTVGFGEGVIPVSLSLLLCMTHYIGKVSPLSFEHYVADIDNLSKWPECYQLAEEVGY